MGDHQRLLGLFARVESQKNITEEGNTQKLFLPYCQENYTENKVKSPNISLTSQLFYNLSMLFLKIHSNLLTKTSKSNVKKIIRQ